MLGYYWYYINVVHFFIHEKIYIYVNPYYIWILLDHFFNVVNIVLFFCKEVSFYNVQHRVGMVGSCNKEGRFYNVGHHF